MRFDFDVDLLNLHEMPEVVFQDFDREMLRMRQLDGVEHDTVSLTPMGVLDLRWQV